MHTRPFFLAAIILVGIQAQGCTTFETVGEKWDEMTQPELPNIVYVHTTELGSQHFKPWVAPNPFRYEGKYFGEFGDTGEYLDIEVFGKDDGLMLTGSRRVETAGLAPATTPIAPTDFEMEYDPTFKTLGKTGFFVIYTDPSGAVFSQPVHGIVLGELFYAKEEPPPTGAEEEVASY